MALDASAALGDLLLKGWTMTADSCPSCKVLQRHGVSTAERWPCQVPLMQNPEDRSLVCVSCLETMEEATSHAGPTRTEVPETVDARLGPYALASDQGSVMMEGVHSGEDISNMLACKMLQGFKLLSQNCPQCRTPLVQRGMDSPMECVACQSTFPLRTASQSTKRSPQGRESPPPTTKTLRATETSTTTACNLGVENWKTHTETVLTQKVVQLTTALEAESSRKGIAETVSAMQLCLDVLLKLKEFRPS